MSLPRRSLLAALLCLAPLASARAGIITEIGPFVGELTEDWESFPSVPFGEPFYLPNPSRVMQDHASVAGVGLAIIEPPTHLFWLGSSGIAQPSDGTKGMGLNGTGTVTIIFDTPVTRFGSYWGAATSTIQPGLTDPAFIDISFFDDKSDLIDSLSFTYSRSVPGLPEGDGVLEWYGWASAVAVKSITYTGRSIAVDGWQADVIPEPGSLVLLLVGVLFSKRKLARSRN